MTKPVSRGRKAKAGPKKPSPGIEAAVTLYRAGELEAARLAFLRVVAAVPEQAVALYYLAVIAQSQGRLDEALDFAGKAAATGAEIPEITFLLGCLHLATRQWQLAAEAFSRAIALRPGFASAYNNLGQAYQMLGRLDEAAASYRSAIAADPGLAASLNNLGSVLQRLGDSQQALAVFRQALAAAPGMKELHYNIAFLLQQSGNYAEAITAGERALALDPDNLAALSIVVYCRQHICDWQDKMEWERRLVGRAVVPSAHPLYPFNMICLPSSPAEQLACARIWASQIAPPLTLPPRGVGSQGKIRLGYLSADLQDHATAFLMAELIELHDRGRFEVFAYSYGPDDGSAMRRRLIQAFDHFVDLRELPDGDAARRIFDDGIDILVDAKGYTKNERSTIAACRPAPIQVNFLAFPGTMGADWIDYIIVDPFLVPAEDQRFFSERLVHLPDSYQPNDRKREIAEQTPSRAECGLPDEGLVFCCFNNTYKITPEFFDVWMRLLAQVPGSVLWLLEGNAGARINLCREAELRGIGADRLVFADRQPLARHLARHRLADLFLDSLPVNAHTTASDALWVGLPVLTLASDTLVGRVAGSLLRAVGLPELVTASLAEYEAAALSLARAPDRLAGLRRHLLDHRRSAPLFDIESYTRYLEDAYLMMRDRAAAGLPPALISVPRKTAAASASAEDLFALGNQLKAAGRPDLAVNAYREALATDGAMVEAANNLANALSGLGRCDEALLAYEQALRLRPEMIEIRFNQGSLLLRMNRPDQAAAAFRKVADAAPNSPDAHHALGTALGQSGDLHGAEHHLRQALALRPDSPASKNNLAAVLAARGLPVNG